MSLFTHDQILKRDNQENARKISIPKLLNLRPIENYDDESNFQQQQQQQFQLPQRFQQPLPLSHTKKSFPKAIIVQGFDDSFQDIEDIEMTKENLNTNQKRFVHNSAVKIDGKDAITIIESARPNFIYIRDINKSSLSKNIIGEEEVKKESTKEKSPYQDKSKISNESKESETIDDIALKKAVYDKLLEDEKRKSQKAYEMYLEQEFKHMEETANRLEELRERSEKENKILREDAEALLMELQKKKENLDRTAEKFPNKFERISVMEEIFRGNQALYSEVDQYFKEIDYDYHDEDLQAILSDTHKKIEKKPNKAPVSNPMIEKKKASHKLPVKAFDSRRAKMTFKPPSPKKKTKSNTKIEHSPPNNKVFAGPKNPKKVQHVIAGAKQIIDKWTNK